MLDKCCNPKPSLYLDLELLPLPSVCWNYSCGPPAQFFFF